MGQLDGKYTVVTGGGKGIGRAVVERFLKEGAAGVAILDYDEATAQATAAELADKRVLVVKCDVSDEAAVEAAFKKVYEAFGRVDVLINNAGLTRDAMFHKMTTQQWDTVVNANLKGVYLCSKQVVPAMREQMYGKIVNISSTSAWGNIGQANYAATKAGIMGLTATMALELGPKNITVNAIAPGTIKTDILKTVPQHLQDKWVENIPLRRLGEPEELANAVLFLASDESSYVSGITMMVCGGRKISF